MNEQLAERVAEALGWTVEGGTDVLSPDPSRSRSTGVVETGSRDHPGHAQSGLHRRASEKEALARLIEAHSETYHLQLLRLASFGRPSKLPEG